ncbi:MAG: 2-oxo acid dehydrogenase subunit E2 [Ardenticatenales bacterium]|nr:2-oxo acid dehydrogenase subunit E2 [Ardenticatenales bacterium]
MAAEVTMPKMGYDMTEGTVLKWLKAEGDAVAKGDILAEIETGKVTIEMEAFDEGVLRKIVVAEGATVPVGQLIAIIAGADEKIDGPSAAAAPTPASPPSAAAPAPLPARAEPEPGPSAAPPSPGPSTNGSAAPAPTDARLRASPLARRIAADRNVDLRAVAGSGPGGRITRDDVLSVAAPAVTAVAPGTAAARPAVPVSAPAGQREALSRIRTTIAQRLSQSWQAAPHIFVTMAIEMDAALALRVQVNEALAATGGGKVSVNDIVVKACGKALRAHPLLNVSWDDGARIRHDHIHIGVAVSLDDGLITVVAPDVDVRPLGEVGADIAGKAQRAREGKLTADDMATASTFTVTNLGMFGVESFTAIINPPEACILAVGAAVPSAVVVDGAVVVRSVMKVTLSADHRVVDGASAAAFLVTLKQLLEHPLGMLV